MWLPVAVLLPALVGVTAPHTHTESHDHDHDHEAAEAAEELHDHGAPPAPDVDPLLVGADTTDASTAELDAAVSLVEDTRAAVTASFTDTASAEAAGYVWIGDGRRVGRYQHYINPLYVSDGIDLDPERIESLVFENTEAGPVLVSTMYVLAPGSTMDDVPDVAGELTVWHDHDNLCWDDTGTKLAGVSTDGVTCRPGGTLRQSPPMLHVWLIDHECGPFAGIEAHGSGGCATHAH